ncbi:MAG: hypothetical protein EXS05_00790 [Planctomycetaceae bacterium]|nr:hypothetical protein [Planctomycetaceae bacterium]
MAEFTCPTCRAEIEPDLIEKTGRAECPFCGTDLSALGLPEPAVVDVPDLPAAAVDGGEPDESGRRPELDANPHTLPKPPEKSLIRVVESSGDRLVLFIPGGGKQSGVVGCFALIWNGFMGLITPAMLVGILKDKGGDAPSLWLVISFLSLFWAVGLGMEYLWLKMKYERTLLLLDRERVAVQKKFFNRKRLHETVLGPDSRAELVESYQQNDTPVYRIEVRGTPAAAKFGTALGDDEKNWLVDRINEFLGVSVDDGAIDAG